MRTIPPIYNKALEVAVSLQVADEMGTVILNERVREKLYEFMNQIREDDKLIKAMNEHKEKGK